MKRLIVTLIVLITLSTTFGRVALADHSYAGFDRDQTVTIEGELETLLFANGMELRTAD
jgi:hypothetical protein